MKRYALVLLSAALTLTLLPGCGQQGDAGTQPGADASGESSAARVEFAHPAGITAVCRIVDGAEDGELLLADLNGGEDAVYRLDAKEIPVTLDGEPASAADLRDGMAVTVSYNGNVEETFPARFGDVTGLAAETPVGGLLYDLCGFYLQVMDDLWNADPALNQTEGGETVTYVGVDLSQAPGGLAVAEKAALVWRMGELHGAEAVAGTHEELVEQGYIDGENLYWEDGVLLSIKPNDRHASEGYSLPTLCFDAEKWRGGLGAYFFYDCTATWPEFGAWTGYTVGAQMIS